jgi:histidine triad (HIT) family protein
MSEVAAAQAASPSGPTIFDKILDGSIPSTKVHEDDLCLAFRDISPAGPTHVVLIPKIRDGLTQLSLARSDQKGILGHLMYTASQIGKAECPDGFRVVVNDGVEGAQSVYHLHLHVIGGRQMNWPPG